MNIECRSNVFCLFLNNKRLSEVIPPFVILRFDIRYSAVRFKISRAINAVNLIRMKTVSYGV